MKNEEKQTKFEVLVKESGLFIIKTSTCHFFGTWWLRRWQRVWQLGSRKPMNSTWFYCFWNDNKPLQQPSLSLWIQPRIQVFRRILNLNCRLLKSNYPDFSLTICKLLVKHYLDLEPTLAAFFYFSFKLLPLNVPPPTKNSFLYKLYKF